MCLCSTTLTFCWHSVHYDQRREMGPTESTYLIWLYTILLQVVIERKSSIKVTFLTTCMHSCCVALRCSLDAVGSHCLVNLKSSVHLIQHKHYYYIDNILFCNSYLSWKYWSDSPTHSEETDGQTSCARGTLWSAAPLWIKRDLTWPPRAQAAISAP